MGIIGVSHVRTPKGAALSFYFRDRSELFDNDDHRPLPHTELTPQAEEAFFGYADEYAVRRQLAFTIVLPDEEWISGKEALIADAVHRHFSRRIPGLVHDLKLIRREGIYSFFLMLGTIVAAGVFVALMFNTIIALTVMSTIPPDIVIFVVTGLLVTIANWVTFWATIEIFLYDYRNLHRKMRIYRKIARSPVEVRAGDQDGKPQGDDRLDGPSRR